VEEDEEVLLTPITPEDVRRWVEIAALQLQRATGVELAEVQSIPAPSVERSYVDWLDAFIPVGRAFYPCCGSDTVELPRLLGPHVSVYHFADAYRGRGRVRPGRVRPQRISVECIGNVVVGPSRTETAVIEGQQAVFHEKDGLLTLVEDIRDLSVFYYRGDSSGEGGSGQRVLGPVGFHSVLARLLDGGLICSDGSNLGYYDDLTDKYAPWNTLAGAKPFSAPVQGSQFEYFNRRFTCLAILERARPVYVWQMVGLAD
jgi:hypothetical protein